MARQTFTTGQEVMVKDYSGWKRGFVLGMANPSWSFSNKQAVRGATAYVLYSPEAFDPTGTTPLPRNHWGSAIHPQRVANRRNLIKNLEDYEVDVAQPERIKKAERQAAQAQYDADVALGEDELIKEIYRLTQQPNAMGLRAFVRDYIRERDIAERGRLTRLADKEGVASA